jgi:hypothetical protein
VSTSRASGSLGQCLILLLNLTLHHFYETNPYSEGYNSLPYYGACDIDYNTDPNNQYTKTLESLFESLNTPAKEGPSNELSRFSNNTLTYLSPATKRLQQGIASNGAQKMSLNTSKALRESRKSILYNIDWMIQHGMMMICVVCPFAPPHEHPAPLAEAFVIMSYLPDASCAFSKTDCTCAPFLYPSCIFVLVNVVHRDGRTCQFPLKHLFEVILVVLVAEVKYMRESMSRSFLMSNAFAIFSLPPIPLLNPLQFLPMIQNIPGCLVLGVLPCICSRSSCTASSTRRCLSLVDSWE